MRWPAHLSGRPFVSQRWKQIDLVARELLYRRFVPVSRVFELVGVKPAV